MPGAALLWKVEAALEGGCRLIQYRNKLGSPELQQREAAELRSLCKGYGALLIINDSPELAGAIGADGLHIGQGDTPLATARSQLGESAIIGVTCHDSLEFAEQAADAGANYLAFGRFFASQTKPEAPPASLDLLHKARNVRLPLVAIGGINRDNAPLLIRAGADCLAVSHELFSSDDPDEIRRRAEYFTSLFTSSFSQAQELP